MPPGPFLDLGLLGSSNVVLDSVVGKAFAVPIRVSATSLECVTVCKPPESFDASSIDFSLSLKRHGSITNWNRFASSSNLAFVLNENRVFSSFSESKRIYQQWLLFENMGTRIHQALSFDLKVFNCFSFSFNSGVRSSLKVRCTPEGNRCLLFASKLRVA